MDWNSTLRCYVNQTLHYPTILLSNVDLFSFFLLFIILFRLTVPLFLPKPVEGDLLSSLRSRCRELATVDIGMETGDASCQETSPDS